MYLAIQIILETGTVIIMKWLKNWKITFYSKSQADSSSLHPDIPQSGYLNTFEVFSILGAPRSPTTKI